MSHRDTIISIIFESARKTSATSSYSEVKCSFNNRSNKTIYNYKYFKINNLKFI